MSGRTFVVAGAGVAGLEAAAEARRRDPGARVVLLSGEAWPFYARIRLPEVVAGRVAPERLVLKPPAWYEEQRIELRLGTRLEGIDASAGVARCAGGETLPYDALCLATGARPFVPPVTGGDLDGVVTLRAMADALAIRERALRGGPAVVVGGGLLGLELAASLAALGMAATVIEVAPWLLPRQLDREAGELLRGILERRGIAFRLAARLRAIAGDGRVEAVELEGGERLPASMVAVSAGVRPDPGPAREAGVAVERGIVVDDAMRTSVPGVFAAGDCTEHRGELYGIWPASEAQGRAAGAGMASGEATYAGTLRQATLKVADVAVFSIGVVPDGAAPGYRHRDGDVYRRVAEDAEGRATGAILVGDVKERRAVAAAVTGRTPYRPGG